MDLYLSALILALALSVMGFGIYITMRIFNMPDITTDGSYTLGAVVSSLLIVQNVSPLIAILVTLCAGALAGTATGLIQTRTGMNPLLAGILVMTALYSINLTLLGRPNQPLINTDSIFQYFKFTENQSITYFTALGIIVLLLIIAITWLLNTDFGIAMRATGSSESMVRANGVNTSKMKIIGLAIANGLTAFSGSLVAQYQGFVDINMGIGIVILGLGSVMIGEAIMQLLKNRSIALNLVSVVIGSLVFRLILAWVLALGVSPNLLKLVTALFVLLVVALPKAFKLKSQ